MDYHDYCFKCKKQTLHVKGLCSEHEKKSTITRTVHPRGKLCPECHIPMKVTKLEGRFFCRECYKYHPGSF